MQALRDQLAAVEGFLQDRDKKFRELSQEYKRTKEAHAHLYETQQELNSALNKHAAALEQDFKNLQLECEELRGRLTGTESTAASRLIDQLRADLGKKTRECDRLAQQATLDSSKADLCGDPANCDHAGDARADRCHERVVADFTHLKDSIRALTLEHFNTPVDPKLANDRVEGAFYALAGDNHHKYLTKRGLVCYIFRAFIWQWLLSRVFNKSAVAWPTNMEDDVKRITTTLRPHIDKHELRSWRRSTADLVYRAWPLEAHQESISSCLVERIGASATEAYANGGTHGSAYVKDEVARIVGKAMRLERLVSDMDYALEPMARDGLLGGFAPDMNSMTVKGVVGSGSEVTLFTTPCLTRLDDGGPKQVILKAEVIC